ncbi:MAG: dihydroneopterin aldolase [Flammeovirgaceae bacterium]|nr:dihydroneopterin aldolase [Flammeovirgaceae bacterium]|tara:strand:+ start:577 stop:939 length:363 start_codon:yes stop_codon:yes gene_type:complete
MKIKGSSISLNDIKFHSKIGLYDFEKEEGNDFIVNISVHVNDLKYDDNISSTVDYENIFGIINAEMGKECNLIETVAHNISSRIHSEIKSVNNCKLEIIKVKPPLDGKVGSSSFKLETNK